MGGYGGSSGRVKKKNDCYYDSQNKKVTDKNAIEVAEYYLKLGMYVVFLNDKYSRPDLLVDYELLVEVKGVTSPNPSQISKQLKKASRQIESEYSHVPEDKRLPAKIMLILQQETFEIGYHAIFEGYKEAKRKNQVHFEVEFLFQGKVYTLE